MKWGRSVVSDSLQPHGLWPARLLRPWDSPGRSAGVDCHSLLQGIFLTQGSNPGLLHCRQTLDRLSHPGSTMCVWRKAMSAERSFRESTENRATVHPSPIGLISQCWLQAAPFLPQLAAWGEGPGERGTRLRGRGSGGKAEGRKFGERSRGEGPGGWRPMRLSRGTVGSRCSTLDFPGTPHGALSGPGHASPHSWTQAHQWYPRGPGLLWQRWCSHSLELFPFWLFPFPWGISRGKY